MRLTTCLFAYAVRLTRSMPSASLDWRSILHTVLPHTDVFAPSLAELVFMLDRPRFERECVESGIGAVLCDSLH